MEFYYVYSPYHYDYTNSLISFPEFPQPVVVQQQAVANQMEGQTVGQSDLNNSVAGAVAGTVAGAVAGTVAGAMPGAVVGAVAGATIPQVSTPAALQAAQAVSNSDAMTVLNQLNMSDINQLLDLEIPTAPPTGEYSGLDFNSLEVSDMCFCSRGSLEYVV